MSFSPSGWVTYHLAKPKAVVQYSLTSANDTPGRDPKDFTLQGSNDGSTWTDLDQRTEQSFSGRYATNSYTFHNTTAYSYYRLNVTANSGDSLLQLGDWDISDSTAPADRTDDSYGTPVVTNNDMAVPSTGTVSEVDLTAGKQIKTFPVDLEPSALLAVGKNLIVANTDDDSVTTIDTAKQRLGRTFTTNPAPGAPFGAQPNALAMLDPTHLAVSLGMYNTVAVYGYHGAYTQPTFEGLVPTGQYPCGIALNPATKKLVVASDEGLGSAGADGSVDEGTGTSEDDSQNGVDHVDGHRNPTLVISPYARRGAVVHDYYSQLNVLRTIEQILGLPPMNQEDMAAEPMYDAFTNKADYTPCTYLPNQVSLTSTNPQPSQTSSPIAKAWAQWSAQQDFKTEDMVNVAQENRDIWYSTNNFTKPYPGDSKVLLPSEVSGTNPLPDDD
ncbi:galactose-binding domain-containing protein [Streptomyces sp. NPDC002514]|uniref:galactose-binding domain-containing protein n=1 Tax=Streptomyces sp. NPDC001270 TaxID=3364554 RepID=UPI0036A71C6A